MFLVTAKALSTMSNIFIFILALSSASSIHRRASNSSSSGYDFVNPLIGTANGGHVFAGATLPFGMAKAVTDTVEDGQGGFASDGGQVTGFSHMHDSGTGGSNSLGNFPLFPQPGCPGDELANCQFTKTDRAINFINDSVIARPGYFSIGLESGVQGEMTVTNHTALYRFTFPTGTTSNFSKKATPTTAAITTLSPLILLDLTDLPNSRLAGTAAVDPSTARMIGQGTFQPSFGIGQYNLYFCADFQGASIRDTGAWQNNHAGSKPKNVSVVADGINVGSEILPSGVYAQFNAPDTKNQLLARVGVSFISIDQACSNAETEIPGFDFDGTESAAEAVWRDKLSVISVDATGVDDSFQEILWSGVYRSMISPQDYTGENPLWESDEPYYDSYYW